MRTLVSRYIPRGLNEIASGHGLTVYGTYEGKPTAIAFQGRAKRHLWYYTFRSVERMREYIEKALEQAAKSEAHKLQRKEERKKRAAEFSRKVKAGDVFYSSWGYEQTNIDFYEVISHRGFTLTLRAIDKKSLGTTGWASDRVVAAKGEYIGDAFTRRITDGHYIRIDDVRSASLWDGAPKERSWYA
jgi:hypothetical protein